MKKLFLLLVACVICTTGCSSKVNEEINCTMDQDSSIYKSVNSIKMTIKDGELKTSVINVDLDYKDAYLKYYDDNAFKSIKQSLDLAYAKFKDYDVKKTDKGVAVEVRLTAEELFSFIGRTDDLDQAKNITEDDVKEIKDSISSQGYKCN